MLKRLLPDPFVLALIATVLLATFLPARGAYASAVSGLATAAVTLLFFFHGAKLSREQILGGIKHWRLHLVILSATFLLFPVLGLTLRVLLPGWLPSPLWVGILFLCLLPSTVQSSIAFTSMARGNVPAAIAAASASQILGVFITPALVALVGDAAGATVAASGIGSVLLMILAPFLAGHLLRPVIGEWVSRHKAAIALSDRSAILLSVYSAFSAAVIEGLWTRVPLSSLGLLALLCAIMLSVALLATYFAGRFLGFNREDRIALLFCGTKKSLVQGVPMARVLFAGPDLGLVLLPIMVFHQMQLMVCAWIARHYARSKSNV